MEELKKLAQDILRQGSAISLGIVDAGGPWVSNLIYIEDEAMNIFWTSDPEVRHSKALKNSSSAAASIMINTPDHKTVGLQIAGTAAESPITDELKGKYCAKFHMQSADRPGHVWYKLTPKFLDIIDEPLFGWNKKKLEL